MIIAFIIALLTYPVISTSQVKSSREDAHLKGPVKKTRLLEGKPAFKLDKWVDGTLNATEIVEYTVDGNIVESQTFKDGKPVSKIVRIAKDNSEKSTYWDDGKLWYYSIRKFNSRGDEIEDIRYIKDPKRYISKVNTEYDKSGKLIKRIVKYDDDTFTSIYTYSDIGNLIELMIYNKDESIYSKSIYKYDTIAADKSTGMRATQEEKIYNASGQLEDQAIYSYDSSGHLRTYKLIKPLKDRLDIHQEYNEKELCYYSLKYTEKFNWEKQITIYDHLDNPIAYYTAIYYMYPTRESDRSYDQDTVTVDIEYDSYDNWIRKTHKRRVEKFGKVQDEPYWIERREITYFKE